MRRYLPALLIGLLTIPDSTAAAPSIVVNHEHCELVALSNKVVAKRRDRGTPMELMLAEIVYTRTLLPKDTVDYWATYFVYQWTPIVYKVYSWTAEDAYRKTYNACMLFLGERLQVPLEE